MARKRDGWASVAGISSAQICSTHVSSYSAKSVYSRVHAFCSILHILHRASLTLSFCQSVYCFMLCYGTPFLNWVLYWFFIIFFGYIFPTRTCVPCLPGIIILKHRGLSLLIKTCERAGNFICSIPSVVLLCVLKLLGSFDTYVFSSHKRVF